MTLAPLALSLLLAPSPQQTLSKDEFDLTWKLPHDRAALYEVYDASTGARRQDFCLLACELDTRVGANDTRGLPFRFIFKRPPSPLKTGSSWSIKEFAFDAIGLRGVYPLLISGTYKVLQIKKILLQDHFKAPFRSSKGKPSPVEAALIAADLDVFKCNVLDDKGVLPAEQRPSAKLSLLVASRLSDGAVLAARYHWLGREEVYSILSGPAVSKANDTIEILLREPILEISKEALRPRIDAAIQNGISYLKSRQAKDGRIADDHYPVGTNAGIGATAMALQALLHSGLPPGDPSIQAGFKYLSSKKIIQSYDLALCLMALEAKYLPLTFLEDLEKFSEDKAREEIRKNISKEDAAHISEWTHALQNNQNSSGMFGYATKDDIPNFSTTQYAILGLKSASRMGISSPPSVWRRTLSYIRAAAAPGPKEILVSIRGRDGNLDERVTRPYGWGYMLSSTSGQPRVTMTTAALSTMAVCESELVRAKEWTDQDSKTFDPLAWGAAAWIQQFYSVRSTTPEGAGWGPAMIFYHLYGLERAAILWDIRTIGDHDWYLEGATLILSWQHKDGSWACFQVSPVIDTAWALLFLKRATIPVDTGRPHVPTTDNSTRATETPRRP